MKILIATDAWIPQVNGVVTTLTSLVSELSKNHEVKVIEPSLFKKNKCAEKYCKE